MVPMLAPRYDASAFTMTVSSTSGFLPIWRDRKRSVLELRPVSSVVSRSDTVLPFSNSAGGIEVAGGDIETIEYRTITDWTPDVSLDE